MSAYLPPLKINETYNAQDYNYQDGGLSIGTAENRYLKRVGTDSCDAVISFRKNINGTRIDANEIYINGVAVVAGSAGAGAGGGATVSIGTTTTLSGGSSATVSNSGTSQDAIFNFGIPRGINGTNGTNGKSMIWKGEFSSSQTYSQLDTVFYEGSSYICVAGGSNISTSSLLTYFNLMAQKGDKGEKGEKGSPGDSTLGAVVGVIAGAVSGVVAVAVSTSFNDILGGLLDLFGQNHPDPTDQDVLSSQMRGINNTLNDHEARIDVLEEKTDYIFTNPVTQETAFVGCSVSVSNNSNSVVIDSGKINATDNISTNKLLTANSTSSTKNPRIRSLFSGTLGSFDSYKTVGGYQVGANIDYSALSFNRNFCNFNYRWYGDDNVNNFGYITSPEQLSNGSINEYIHMKFYSHGSTEINDLSVKGNLKINDVDITEIPSTIQNIQVDVSTLQSKTVNISVVNGNTSIGSLKVYADGSIDCDGPLSCSSLLTRSGLTVFGNADIIGTLGIVGNLRADNISVTGSLAVSGTTTLQDLRVNGTARVNTINQLGSYENSYNN